MSDQPTASGGSDIESGEASTSPVQAPAVRPLSKQTSFLQNLTDTLFDDGEDDKPSSSTKSPAVFRQPVGGFVQAGMRQRGIGELTASRFKVSILPFPPWIRWHFSFLCDFAHFLSIFVCEYIDDCSVGDKRS